MEKLGLTYVRAFDRAGLRQALYVTTPKRPPARIADRHLRADTTRG